MSARRRLAPVSPVSLADGRISDDELVASIRAGNLSGLGILFDRYGSDVRRLLVRLGVSMRDVDDLVQDTFLDCVGAAATYKPGLAVRSWLFGIAVILVRRHRRSLARMIARAQRWAVEWVEPRVATPSDSLEWAQEAGRGQRALAALSPKKRAAFVLVVLEELSGEEAAAALDVPVRTVWTRVHYARREMMELLERDPP
jgi:RNA polymerase sigma-70 factor (ECF subfamily)